MPSLVTLVWAAAGRWDSARAPTARPSALNDFDISSLLCWPVLGEGWGPAILRRFQIGRRLRHRPLAIHGVDLAREALLPEIPLQLHGRGQFLVFGRQLALDQEELLDGFDTGEIGVHRLDLAQHQILD